MNQRRWLFFVMGILSIVALYPSICVQAQGFLHWSTPLPLGLLQIGRQHQPSFPDIAADPYGRVHVVAVANQRDRNSGLPDGTMLYTCWDGENWSTPVDILVSPSNTGASIDRLLADQRGQLYLLWTAMQDGVFLSQSEASNASSAQAWVTQSIAEDGTLADMAFRGGSEIGLAYVRNNRDILFQRSFDSGLTWSLAGMIWSPPSSDQAVFTLRLAIGPNGIYHVAWTETDAALDYNPSGVWYARSLDEGRTWQNFWYIPDEGSYINIGFDAVGNVHLLWNHSVGEVHGRYHAWSEDGGVSWSGPIWIFPGLSGRTGFPRMILDSAGQLHQFTSGRTVAHESDIYHSVWTGTEWSAPAMLDTVEDDAEEGPAVALTQGNTLHVVWRNNGPIGDILYSASQTDAPAIASLPLLALDRQADSVATPQSVTSEPQGTQVELLSQSDKLLVVDAASPSLFFPLLLGISSAFLLVLLVTMGHLRGSHGR